MTAIPEFLAGGGEMGQRIRDYDWAATPLGPVESWPQSLRTCVRIMLTSRQPIWIGWGKELIKLYNDPYKAIVGGKHPKALGSPASVVWRDIWRHIGPMLTAVMEKDEGIYVESELLIMERNGYPEETYYTFSYTPIPGDDGGTAGMICANTDDTDRIISQRQLRTLTDLGKRLADCGSYAEAIDRTILTLQENPRDFPFVLFYTLALGSATLTHSSDLGIAESRVPDSIDLAGDSGEGRPGEAGGEGPLLRASGEERLVRAGSAEGLISAFRQAMATRQLQILEGLQDSMGRLPTGAWEVSPDKAIIQPMYRAGEKDPYGFLVTGVNPYRLPDEKYTAFLSLVGDQVATSFADIHVLEVERRRAEALAEIDRAKTTFFSNISHEFRTPLTLLISPLEDLLAEPRPGEPGYDDGQRGKAGTDDPERGEAGTGDPERGKAEAGDSEGGKVGTGDSERGKAGAGDAEQEAARRYRLGVAYRNALRMEKLVNTLLEFSRIEAGRLEGQFRRVDIAALTIDLASSFRSAIEKAGMRLHVGARKIAGDVYVDVELWERIILNLVSNAFKYSQQGTISVEVRQEGGEIQVSVSDDGVGIPVEEQERIFDRFHRIENSEGRSQEGTGIGLAMVRELVRLHQGTIGVISAVGVGSTFTVRIPIGVAHLPADRIISDPRGERRLRHADAFVQEAMMWVGGLDATDDGVGEGGGPQNGEARANGKGAGESPRYKVLLADDNADMREYVQRLLSRQFTVITATDGEDAFAKMQEHHPDLLLSDAMMPRLDGFELLKRVRQSADLASTPVILLSARAGEEAKVEGLEAGADDYLVKPFAARELLARVDANIRIARDRSAAMKEYAEKLEQAVRRRTQELRVLNNSLERSNEDLQQFAHVASHDLKEPVRKIRTFSGRLIDEYAQLLPAEAQVFLKKIQQATARMYTMIDGVLNYSAINGSEQPIDTVDLNTVIDQVESDLELVIRDRHATIQRGSLPCIEGAPVLLQQLFYNLLNNSLKFAKDAVNPLITIESRLTEGAGKRIAELTMTDNGIGFDPGQAARIFETFVRLNTKDRYEGTGLGLSLCKKIVERHHGTITATGVLGGGATFVIRLPLTQTERYV
ncbi:MAG TPA: ATP-binding protein [Puia sp.]|nr:ATP-binding protein [Puia sp.]